MDRLRMSDALQQAVSSNVYNSPVCEWLVYGNRSADTSNVNYLDIEGSMMTFLPAGREHQEWPDGSWKSVGRQAMKPARLIRQLAGKDRFAGKELEDFSNIMKSVDVSARATFEIVEGGYIPYWYDEYRYAEDSGSLESSCMRYSACLPYFRIYERNPNIIKMLILKDNKRPSHNLHGRALVWFVPGFDTPIMDRVYGNQATIEAFRRYARAQGWYYRMYNSYTHETAFIKDDERVDLHISVGLRNFAFENYPYMDTMKYFHHETGRFSNRPWKGEGIYTTLNSTDGYGGYYGRLRKGNAESFVTVIDAPSEAESVGLEIIPIEGDPDLDLVPEQQPVQPDFWDQYAAVPVKWTDEERIRERLRELAASLSLQPPTWAVPHEEFPMPHPPPLRTYEPPRPRLSDVFMPIRRLTRRGAVRRRNPHITNHDVDVAAWNTRTVRTEWLR